MELFVDGVSRGTTATITTQATSITFGARNSRDTFFTGKIDEVRISNVARSAGWITTEYNNQNSPSTFYTLSSQATSSTANVQIVVYVDHTTATGDPATNIVTSSTTTINSSTANPFALSIGNDPTGQTFTSANPRRLRVRVNVSAVNGGERFVLAYDGTCAAIQCSNLNTPVVTVPEYGLVFAVVAMLIPIAVGGAWRRKGLAMRARAAHDPFAHSQIQRRGRSSRSGLTDRRKEKRP